jgi:tRNA-specific 2-thiouridylase
MSKELTIKDLNFLSGKSYNGKCQVKIRSTAKMAEGIIKGNKIIFDKPQRAIASGQSAVIYVGNELIGGGIIV